MTVQTKFFNYQSNAVPKVVDDALDKYGYSPALKELRDYLVSKGWTDLGYKPMKRPVRGGKAPSTHSVGALDIRYADPGPGRNVGLWVLNAMLLPYSKELGIQAVHDYLGSRIWRPPGTSGRPKGGIDAGWKMQKASTTNGMGQTWADYFHIELLPENFGQTGALKQVLKLMQPAPGPAPAPPGTPPKPPASFICPFPTAGLPLKVGARGEHVRVLQQQLHFWGRQLYGSDTVYADGVYGPKTSAAVGRWQIHLVSQGRLKASDVDGLFGKTTRAASCKLLADIARL